jgi:hypothetical protein
MLPEHSGSKHDDDCLRRRAEKPTRRYLCTCNLTDKDIARALNRPGDVLDAQAGSQYHLALLLVEAQMACEHAYEEFQHVEDFPPELLAAFRTVIDSEVLV